MKRITAIIVSALLIVVLVFTLSSCGKKVKCTWCGEEGRESSMKHSEILNEDIYTCKECQKLGKDIQQGIGNLFD